MNKDENAHRFSLSENFQRQGKRERKRGKEGERERGKEGEREKECEREREIKLKSIGTSSKRGN